MMSLGKQHEYPVPCFQIKNGKDVIARNNRRTHSKKQKDQYECTEKMSPYFFSKMSNREKKQKQKKQTTKSSKTSNYYTQKDYNYISPFRVKEENVKGSQR